MNVLDYAPTETDIVLANGNAPALEPYDPAGQEPEFLFEVIDGFIVRKTVGLKEVNIANRLNLFLAHFAEVHGLGRGLTELGYDLPNGGPRRKPDVSFLSYDRWAKDVPFPDGDFLPVAPELAVEVISPHELARVSIKKVQHYFRGGAQLVWVVYPHVEQVYVYSSPTQIRVLTRADDLIGDPIIPGFKLALAELFPLVVQP